MKNPDGATPQEWYHFDLELGLGENLLPVVCEENPTPASGSKIKKWGKVPSAYNAQGEAHGIKDWQKRPLLSNELQLWRKDARLGICVRTGSRSGVYAIDVDVTDEMLSQRIRDFFSGWGDTWETRFVARSRENSPKFLVPVEIASRPVLDKRILETSPHGRIELLADGQQFVAAGCHPSGARYNWDGGLPRALQILSVERFESLWSALTAAFSTAPVSARPIRGTAPTSGEVILTAISEEEWNDLISAMRFEKFRASCADNDSWSKVGYALLSLGARGRELFCTWSRDVPNYTAGAPEDWWGVHADQKPRSDYRHIFSLARRCGWGAQASADAFGLVQSGALAAGGEREGSVRKTFGAAEYVSEQDQSYNNVAANMEVSGDTEKEHGPHAQLPDLNPPPPPLRPCIRLIKGEFSNIARHATQIITPEIYKQGNGLARVGRPDEEMNGIKRRGDYRSILPVSSAFLRVLLGDLSDFLRYDGRSGAWVKEDCPADLAVTLLTMGDWPCIRPLDAIARAPFVRLDGSVCDVEGYDPASQVILLPNAQFPKLPAVITREMALEALAILVTPFREFPHALAASESAFVAHILTEAARAAIRTSPMFWYTAPDAGTGKTLLSEMPSAIVHGVQPAVRPWVSESEEIRKTLFASLVAGDRSIMFDNVPSGYKARSAELCAFLTSPVWEDRRLGASEMVKISNRSVLSASGNNVTPVSDMARRSLVVRLDANSTERKQRRFAIANLRAYVGEHRVALLMAALTIIVGYQQNRVDGMPVPLPSFEDWSHMVREPLIWLGLPDPIETQNEETDDEAGAVNGAFAALGLHFAGREFTAASICALPVGFYDTDGKLNQLLMSAGCSDPSSPTKIGYWLRNCRDKIGGGYKLVRGSRSGADGNRWVLKQINGNEDLL